MYSLKMSTLGAIACAILAASISVAHAHNLKCVQARVVNTIRVCPDIQVPAGRNPVDFCAQQPPCRAFIVKGACFQGEASDRCESPVPVNIPGVNFWPYTAAPLGDKCVRDRAAAPTVGAVLFPDGCK
jgi:hypothetical protein